MIPTKTAARYVTPLREGGSLPALVETADGGLYVVKFRGAGQGIRALIAELVAGEIARALGLQVPEIVFMEINEQLGRSEPDVEIQELLLESKGLNLALKYLPSSFAYNNLLRPSPTPEIASMIVWFDAFVTNVDRTPRNVNLLMWRNDIWLIDHGAALYFHHNWDDYLERSRSRFPLIHQHALLEHASELAGAARRAGEILTPDLLQQIVDLIPSSWLGNEPIFASRLDHRQAYYEYLVSRLEASSLFVEEAHNARTQLV